MSLESILRTAASANQTLAAFLTITGDSSAPFRWYDIQIPQGTDFPCVAVQLIDWPAITAANGDMATAYARVQFTVWDADSERARAIEQAIKDFLQTFSASGSPAPPSQGCRVLMRRQTLYTATDQGQARYQRIMDASIFVNEGAV